MPYYKDLTFFDIIDTEAKAYWLGFLYADGWVRHGVVGLKLQHRDRAHVEDLSQALFGCIRVRDRVSRGNVLSTGRVIKGGRSSEMTVSSVTMVSQLRRLGLTSKKSLTHGFPTSDQVPPCLLRHFIRGYFDGDGCLSHRTAQGAKRWIVTILSSRRFRDRLCELLERELHIHTCRSERGRISAMQISGNRQIKTVMDWLYDGATVTLARKHRLYGELCQDAIRIATKPKVSRYRNITYDKARAKWVATVRVTKRTIHVGRYVTEDEAYTAQQEYLNQLKTVSMLDVVPL